MENETPKIKSEKVTKIDAYKMAFAVVWSVLLFLLLMIFNESMGYLKAMDKKYRTMENSMVRIEQISSNLVEDNKDQEKRIRKIEGSMIFSDAVNRRYNGRKKL